MSTVNLGVVTAYGDAKAHGYTGTETEFGAMLAGLSDDLEDLSQISDDLEDLKYGQSINYGSLPMTVVAKREDEATRFSLLDKIKNTDQSDTATLAVLGMKYDSSAAQLATYVRGFVPENIVGQVATFTLYRLWSTDAAFNDELTVENAPSKGLTQYTDEVNISYRWGKGSVNAENPVVTCRFCAVLFDSSSNELARLYSDQIRFVLSGDSWTATRQAFPRENSFRYITSICLDKFELSEGGAPTASDEIMLFGNNAFATNRVYRDISDEDFETYSYTIVGFDNMNAWSRYGYLQPFSPLNQISDEAAALEAKKANTDGAYENMTVGNAEQLMSTVYEEDRVPYTFRTSGGSADIGNRETDMLVGGTVAWNQILTPAVSATIVTNNGDGSLTVNGTTTAATWLSFGGVTYQANHVYLLRASGLGFLTGITGARFSTNSSIGYHPSVSLISGDVLNYLFKYTGTGQTLNFAANIPSGVTVTNQTVIPQAFDLTAMFGSAVADYVYSLEQATADAGAAWFRRLFPKDYYAYNAGELMSVNASAHNTVGFNAFDYTTGTAELVGGNQYQITGAYTSLAYEDINGNAETITPDSDGCFTPTNNGTLTVTGGDSTTTCVHLTWSGYRDGEFEDYAKHSYPLDSSLTLRGIPKLDASNNLYYDGDTYESDGTVTRRYGVVDLGSLTWTRYGTTVNYFAASNAGIHGRANGDMPPLLCPKYLAYNTIYAAQMPDKTMMSHMSSGWLYIRDDSYTDAAAFKAAMSGVYLVYELATPTTETAAPYQNPQVVDDFGTEEYVDAAYAAGTRDVAIPVGHTTQYPADLTRAIERVMEQVPSAPTSNGTYVLKCTVSDGTAAYTWEAAT